MENLQSRNLHFHEIARHLIVSYLPKKVYPNLSKFRYGESIVNPLGSIRFIFIMKVPNSHNEITKPGQCRHLYHTHDTTFFFFWCFLVYITQETHKFFTIGIPMENHWKTSGGYGP